jgi:glycosyltransferase involved in cell wall biosynthesis
VLYINSIVLRKLNVGEGGMFLTRVRRKLRSIARGVVEAEPNFFVFSPVTMPVHHIPGARRLNQIALLMQVRHVMKETGIVAPIVWVACPAAVDAAVELKRQGLAYQRADRMELYPGVDEHEVTAMDRRLKREADVTVFVNRALYEEEGQACRQAFLSDHGVDYELFARAHEDSRVPEEMKELKRPVIGFFGGIDDHTMDVAFAAEVVRRRPDYTFVFVGNASADLAAFEGLGNVRFLGKKAYEEVPHYGKCFDVAIMPWRRNRWIEMCNPIKLKEYLALGKPLVSTPFRELEHYGGVVYVAGDAECFAGALDMAIAEDSPEKANARRARVAGHSWEAKADEVIRAAREAAGARRGGRA